MSTAAFFQIAKKWKQPRYSSTDKWINKMWSLHTREHHSAMKRGEALTLATTWMDPENTMLSDRSQTQKDTQCVIPLMGSVQSMQIYRDRKWIPDCRGWRRGWGATVADTNFFLFFGDETIVELDGVMVAQLCECTKNH